MSALMPQAGSPKELTGLIAQFDMRFGGERLVLAGVVDERNAAYHGIAALMVKHANVGIYTAHLYGGAIGNDVRLDFAYSAAGGYYLNRSLLPTSAVEYTQYAVMRDVVESVLEVPDFQIPEDIANAIPSNKTLRNLQLRGSVEIIKR